MLEPKAERIHQARRAARMGRLHDVGWPEDAAEAVTVEWEAQAGSAGRRRGSRAFWDGFDVWVADRSWY